MKKLFLGMLAIVGMVATSCQQEVDLGVKASGELVEVSLNVQAPTMVNRAYSDGLTATHLQYAVYDEAGNILNDLTVTDATINGSTTVQLQLVTGNTYSVLFWAAAPNAPYTVDLANKTMEVSYTGAVCSDENRDAFYKYHTFTVSGAQTETIELKRPFAQLNIGANDYAEAAKAGLTVTHAKVATSAYTTLDLATGAVDGLTNVEFAYAAAPTSETFPVDDYQYLAMNYLLMAADKETVEVTFYYATDENGANAKSRTVGSIPVQRNYRTNLYGALFTSLVDINVEIKPEYNEYDHNVEAPVIATVATPAAFKEAFENPEVDEIILDSDLNLNDLMESLSRAAADVTLTIKSGKEITLNLNNKKLYATSQQSGNREMFLVKGNLTITNGTIEYEHKGQNLGWGAMSTIFDITAGGSVTLNGVTAKNLGGTDMNFVAHLNNWGECTLNVENSTLESTYIAVRVFNSGYDMNNVTIKNSTLKGKYCYWVHNYKAAGDEVGTDATLNVNIYNGTNTFVYTGKAPVLYGFANPIYETAVKSEAELAAALAANLQVVVDADIEVKNALTVAKDKNVVIKLNNNTVSAVDNATASYALITNQGNLTVVGPGKLVVEATNNRGWNAYSSVISNSVGGNLVVDGGVVIEHLGGTAMAYGIDNLTNGKGTKAVTTVKNATVKSTYRAVRQFLNGPEAFNELYVEAGAVIESTGGNKAIWMQSPSKNANSGKLVVEAGAQLKSNVYLDGADSNGLVLDVNIAKSALVDGATINVELPAGYEVVEENGVCTVVLYTAVSTAAELAAAIKAGGKYVLANDIALDTPIQIDGKDFVLDGNGHKIGQSSIYPIEGTAVAALIHPIGGNVVVKNVVFDGVKTDAAIRTAGTELLLDNVTVKNCNHSKDQGLLRLLGKSTIKNSTFVNNTCKMVVSLNFDGNGTVTSPQVVENCVFEGNTCNTTAVVYYAEGGSATIDGNKFVNNTLNVSNGATVYLGFKKNCTVTNNLFDGNTVTATSKRSSGGLMVGNAAVVTGNCFVNNTVTVNGQTGYGNDVCASPYYAAIDLSGNYWGGNAPVEGDDYYKEYNNYEVIINDYLTTNPLQ